MLHIHLKKNISTAEETVAAFPQKKLLQMMIQRSGITS